MGRLLVIVIIILLIAIIWYLLRERARAEQQRLEMARRRGIDAAPVDRERLAVPSAASPPAGPGEHEGRAGLVQEAADRAAGLGYERAADQLEELTADLSEARRAADLAAANLSRRASDALAAVQAAAATHGGAVPGDGSPDCPADYPIKGLIDAARFIDRDAPDYARTVPDVCFQGVAAAEAAGFAASSDAVAEAVAAADAGSVPPGAIRGDGGRDCPSAYPIKGNVTSMRFHEPGTSNYEATIPELCFSSADSARAAGFSPSGDG